MTEAVVVVEFLSAYFQQLGGNLQVDANEVERRVGRFQEIARRAGVKLTHQRLEIFREVASSADHPNLMTSFRLMFVRIPAARSL